MRGLLLDLVALAGLGTLLVGVHQVFPPAALIIGGGVICAGAVAASRRSS
jgi:hypothetical protein